MKTRSPLRRIRFGTTGLVVGLTVGLVLPEMLFAQQSPQRSPSTQRKKVNMTVTKSGFGTLENGTKIDLYTCTNHNGLVLKLTNYGAIVVAVETPDRNGKMENITLGFDSLEGYLQPHPYFGATVGRYANRIANGKFTLDGQQYTLATNNGPNHLHGGEVGFDKVVWKAAAIKNDNEVGVAFHYTSQDGEEGYPGTVDVTTRYTLTNDDELKVVFTATTDKATPINLTNHNYWNLSGGGEGKILDHRVTINAEHYLAVDDTLIPTGELVSVGGTPLDFTKPTAIGKRIDQIDSDPVGYDHCYVLRDKPGELLLAARVEDPESGRTLEIHTTQPGIQFYTGNFLDGAPANGEQPQHSAFCLETQHYPDSPNQPDFPSTILKPGEKYEHTTIHKFNQ